MVVSWWIVAFFALCSMQVELQKYSEPDTVNHLYYIVQSSTMYHQLRGFDNNITVYFHHHIT